MPLHGYGSADRFLLTVSVTGEGVGHHETTGGRLIQNYNVIGGVMADIHPNLINRIKEFIKYLPDDQGISRRSRAT